MKNYLYIFMCLKIIYKIYDLEVSFFLFVVEEVNKIILFLLGGWRIFFFKE